MYLVVVLYKIRFREAESPKLVALAEESNLRVNVNMHTLV